MAKTALELILTAKNNKYSLNFMLTLSKWISNPTFSCEEFHVIKNTLFVIIAATICGKYHHNNILSVLDQNQKEDEDGLYFSPEVIKMTDGIRMFEKLSINDVALTCVSLQNCVQICLLHKESTICDEIVCNNGTDMESIKSSVSEKTYCSRSHCLTSESSTGMLWNENLRKKSEFFMEICGVEAYDTIKKLIEENTNVQIFTGGKRYTGGVSGSGHSWTLAGVKTYKSIRKNLVSDMEDFKNIHFNYKKQEEKLV